MTPWLLPLIPLFAAVIAALPVGGAARGTHGRGRVPALPRAAALTALVVTLGFAVWIAVHGASSPWSVWIPALHPALRVSDVGRAMVVLVPAIALPVVVASAWGSTPAPPRLLALLLAFTGAMELLVSASDFATLLVGWELVGVASWALIGYEWRDAWRVGDARSAFLVTRFGDLGLYLAAAAAFTASGSVSFGALGSGSRAALNVVAAGVLLAAAAKSAQLPFSPWLFAAMAGPTPASALLHSATMVAAGAYLLAKLTPILSPAAPWLPGAVALLGGATAIAGGLVALVQHDLKKALAASTSAQYGLMLVAIGAGFPMVAALHLVAHAMVKALLFLCAGAVLHAAGTLDLGRLRPGTASPRIARLFGIGTLALAAVPPLGGAYTKEQIVAAAAVSSVLHGSLLAIVLVAGTLGAAYGFRLYLLVFGRLHSRAGTRASRATPGVPRGELLAIAGLAAGSIGLGVLWIPGVATSLPRFAFGSLAPQNALEFAASLLTVVIAASGDWLLWRRGALLSLGVPPAVSAFVANWFGLPAVGRRFVVRPVVAAAAALARMDRGAVDRGVMAAAAVASALAGALAWSWERGLDGTVMGVATLTRGAAGGSRALDDRGVDAAVEQLARRVGVAGRESRRTQTGLTHQYYLMLAAGIIAMLAVAVVTARGYVTVPAGR